MLREEIASRLLKNVYHPVSAVFEMGEQEEIVSAVMFDTEFGSLPPLLMEGTKEIWLFTNHPEGRSELYEKDWENIRLLRSLYPQASLRVMITNEDIACREYALFMPGEL